MEGWSQLWHTTRTGFVASAWCRNEFESGEIFSGGNFFCRALPLFWWALLWWSVQFGQLLVCFSSAHGAPPCPMESAPLFVAVLCVAVIIVIDTHALTRLFRSGLPRTSVPYPTKLFENSSDLHHSQDWPWRRLGGRCPHLPPVTTLIMCMPNYWNCWNGLLISWIC